MSSLRRTRRWAKLVTCPDQPRERLVPHIETHILPSAEPVDRRCTGNETDGLPALTPPHTILHGGVGAAAT
jgi:hypothetical protein